MKLPSVYDENNNLASFYQNELDENNLKVKKILLSNSSYLDFIMDKVDEMSDSIFLNLEYSIDIPPKAGSGFSISIVLVLPAQL